MQSGDFLLCTFDGDTGVPPTNYSGQIGAVDPAAQTFDCALPDIGQTLTVDCSAGTTEPWPAADASGASHTLATHDIYVGQPASPGQGDMVILEFADQSAFLGTVESITETMNVQLFVAPYPRLGLSLDVIAASDWADHGVGEQLISVRRCVRDGDAPPAAAAVGSFTAGWWSLATRRDAHPARSGGAITPFATVVHTTDMPPETFATLIGSWTTTAGNSASAHFVIGRSAADGVVQLVPIDHASFHAGGSGHGSFVAGSQSWQPNSVAIGIEIHCAGGIRQTGGAWHLFEGNTPQGNAIPDIDVVADPQRPGRGWHVITDYQYAQLTALLDGLEAVLAPLPDGCVAQSIEPPPAYGLFPTGRLVGHVSLHAAQRADPWPPACDWLRARLAAAPA